MTESIKSSNSLNLSIMKSKKGSFSVFAVMIFSALLILTMAAVRSAQEAALSSAVDSFGRVWGKSVLGEFDLYLKDRYGILGFYGNNHSVEEKLGFYARYSLEDKEYIRLDGISADTGAYAFDDADSIKKQIEDAVLYFAEPDKKAYVTPEIEEQADRYISSERIINSLPSRGKTESLYILGVLSKIKGGISIRNLCGEVAADKYILTFFRDYMNSRDLNDTYFDCEIEYILSGKLSDAESKQSVKRNITAIRNLLNLYYLYTCPEKKEAVIALAETMTPGPAAALTQAVIMETWAYMEAENDINILYNGETVPLLKKDCNWALTLENVFGAAGEAAAGEQEYISPQVLEGEDYKSYLAVLLCGLPEQTKLLRIMDLIQINAKYVYCGSFLLKDYCGGLEYDIKVNGNAHGFEETY